MSLGYDADLFILAFDHRGSFRKRFGIEGPPTDEQMETLRDAKMLVYEGFTLAAADGMPGAGVLVDEEMGTAVAEAAREAGVTFAMPVEKSGQPVFDFEYDDDFGTHIERFDPTFSKVLVRWNPSDDAADKEIQGQRLKKLSDWLHDRDRKFLFELLVPAHDEQLAMVDGDTSRYDTELRPTLTLETMAEIRQAGIEPDIWKIEGLDDAASCEAVGTFITAEGRDAVSAVVLGRGADDAKVDHWLETGAPVAGYRGFAIGRSIWGPGIDGFVAGDLDRAAAAQAIADAYRRFYDVYQSAAG